MFTAPRLTPEAAEALRKRLSRMLAVTKNKADQAGFRIVVEGDVNWSPYATTFETVEAVSLGLERWNKLYNFTEGVTFGLCM